ncbi:MAG: histone [Candidatus Altiarchaeota archaeon]|nr:histone [Candidatus Altiarchaeota archaeon]
MSKNKVVPFAAVERLARKAGAERISVDAIKTLSEILKTYAEDVSIKAVKYARYAKRSTIKREDVELSASE